MLKSEPNETSIYSIIKNILSDDIDESNLSDDEVIKITNKICQNIVHKYIIIRK